jgi:hypothetical protein
MQHITQEMDTWYITRAFPRGKMGKRSLWWNYVSRQLNRTYGRLKDWGNLYGLYSDFLGEFYTADQLDAFFGDVSTGWGLQTWGVSEAFQKLVETVLMPNVAGYANKTDWEGKTWLEEEYNGMVQLGVDQARYYSTDWSRGGTERECGYFWYDCLHHFGWYLDKMAAIMTLTRSDTNFVGRATPEDVREWLVGYYGTFTDQMLKLNYSMMSEDWSKTGPYIANGELKWPSYTGPLDVDVSTLGTPVTPFATFTVQMFWQVLGQIGWNGRYGAVHHFNENFTRSFSDESNLLIKSAGNADIFGSSPTIEFTDPISGLTFFTKDYTAINNGRPTAAEGMIDRANRMFKHSSYCDLGLSCEEPSGGWSKVAVDTEMGKYVQLMRIVADLNSLYVYGHPFSP